MAGALSLRAAAAERPRRPALVAGDETLTFSDLMSRVARRSTAFHEAGIGVGDRVTFVARPTVDTAITFYAAAELGAVSVPIHPKLTPGERDRERRALAPCFGAEDIARGEGASRPHHPGWRDVHRQAPIPDDAPLAIVQTSGTAGRPKRVVLSRAAFVASASASAHHLGWQPRDRWLLCMSPAHVGGLSVLVRTLAARRCTVLGAPGSFDVDAIARIMERERVTLASLVPTMLTRLLERDPRWQPPARLRAVLLGGGPASPGLLERAARRGVPVLPSYGLTETCGQVATRAYDERFIAGAHVGHPLSGVALRIAGGEIQARGPMCMSNWFPTGAHPSPFTEDGWLRTGDAGRWDGQGRLHVLGRLDDRIVTGGENVDPVEVEQALSRLPAVADACVFGVADATWGRSVAAAIVPATPGHNVRLRTSLCGVLAAYKRPRLVAMVDHIPTTPSGKRDRAATAALARPRLTPPR